MTSAIDRNPFCYVEAPWLREAPGTGTPVAGGLTSNRAPQSIRGLKGLDIRGMDRADLSPACDHAGLTALAAATLAAATLALEMLYIRA